MSQPPPPPPPEMSPLMMSQDGQPAEMPPSSYYAQEPGDHLTGGLPINLDSLRDGPPGSKPFYPYSTLIRYAIKGSPQQKLLLEDIYYAVESRFPYFRTAPNGWKNSVRHNLSLNPCFVKVPRPLTDRGKGSYWTVDDNVDPRTGVHRIRKKKTKGSKRNSEDPDVDYQPPDASYDDAHFVQHPEETDANTAMGSFPTEGYQQPPPPPPNIPMMAVPGMPFPRPVMPYSVPKSTIDEGIGLDEHGQIDWRMAWLKELSHLQQVTAEQEKAQVEQEWYHMMFYRLRAAFGTMEPIPPHGMVPPQPNPEEIQQQQPQQQQQQ